MTNKYDGYSEKELNLIIANLENKVDHLTEIQKIYDQLYENLNKQKNVDKSR